MVWWRKVDKPLSELMLTRFTDAWGTEGGGGGGDADPVHWRMGNGTGGGGGAFGLSWFNLIHAYSNYSGIKHLTGFISFLTERFIAKSLYYPVIRRCIILSGETSNDNATLLLRLLLFMTLTIKSKRNIVPNGNQRTVTGVDNALYDNKHVSWLSYRYTNCVLNVIQLLTHPFMGKESIIYQMTIQYISIIHIKMCFIMHDMIVLYKWCV